MSPQSNVLQGALVILAGEDLSSLEDYLVVITHDSGTPEVLLPTSDDDQALYLIKSGDTDTNNVDLLPLEPGRNFRVKFKGTGSPGDMVVLADPSVSADKGKLRKLPTAAGTYRVHGWLEETAVDGQLALIRWSPQGNTTVN